MEKASSYLVKKGVVFHHMALLTDFCVLDIS